MARIVGGVVTEANEYPWQVDLGSTFYSDSAGSIDLLVAGWSDL